MSYMGKKNTLAKIIHSKHIPCRSFITEQQVTQEVPFETLILHKLTNTRAHTHTHTHTHKQTHVILQIFPHRKWNPLNQNQAFNHSL